MDWDRKWFRPSHDSETLTKREVKRQMTAIFETGGKQYRVNEGDVIYV